MMEKIRFLKAKKGEICGCFWGISNVIRNFAHVMRYLILIMLAAAFVMGACRRSGGHMQTLSEAERVVGAYPDSALDMISHIEPSDLKEDSAKALYYLVAASAHKAKESSMAPDSLVRIPFEYYRKRDVARFVRAADLYALHRFWSGDEKGALHLLDSMIRQSDIPDSLMITLLRTRVGVGGAGFDCKRNIGYIKRLMRLDKDSANQYDYKYQLCENYQFAGYREEALSVINELIDYARLNGLESEVYQYTYEKIGILEELGRYADSNALVDYFLQHDPEESALPYLRFWKALIYFNMGDFDWSARELALADSCAEGRADVDRNYYESFVVPLHGFLEYRRKGVITLSQLASMNNRQHHRFDRMETTRWETEQNLLRQENRALTLKARDERKTAILIIVVLGAVIIALGAIWNIQKRKRKTIEAEERAETLQKMVDEMNASVSSSAGQDSLRRAMLQQLGIIRMVAEAPTEQNRELLRKISSVDGDTGDSLVNWKNVFEIIDNLYSGFYSRLHDSYGDLLSDKEEQIIVLMAAGFSTKEISVITGQTTATIYVRKTSVRKKLGVPEKEDIIAFLRRGDSPLESI